MRRKLKKFCKNNYHSFSGKVSRMGFHSFMLTDVKGSEGYHLTNHIWIPKNKKNKDVELGDIVKFSAMVTAYRKIGDGNSYISDYGFSHIKNFQIIKKRKGA